MEKQMKELLFFYSLGSAAGNEKRKREKKKGWGRGQEGKKRQEKLTASGGLGKGFVGGFF